MKIEITIPVLNEEKTIVQQIEKIVSFISLLNCRHSFSLIISDNGSTDNTMMLGKVLEEDYSGIVHYLNVGKRGVGLALKTSWLQSAADYVGYMDLDLATDLNHIIDILNVIESHNPDIIYGSRLHRNSRVVGRSLKREVTSRVFNRIVRSYMNTSFSDGMCGFKFLKRSIAKELINAGASSDGWFFCTEILIVAEWNKKYLYELPVRWTDDANSKVNIKNLTIEYIKAMYNLKRRYK
ncbi:glycosyltransferase [Yersinia enterocolitica]|uniref:glycosyltransferase n=1 Tax=Yersinia enterocolitica TaxID=630 RepID=UPI00155AE59B|nr:glycosyltransferase [Yersinia enterocolitica]MBX9482628.1 glycosyltransferase [Yersinia enterocolitica]NQS94630.1 glycosyltransferase [Yersinia enterocolitica]NQT44840.1 glycosyltransferase [Yersinia enterocolitica]NQT99329.1 glycosyltransferase [Yersinia enterocolitica]HDM8446655.1 glycosyltransferase [Yersinia enterocolitica]